LKNKEKFMYKKTLIILITITYSLFTYSQNKFKVDTSRTPKQYLYHILDTNNVKIANIKYKGLKSSIGQFNFDVNAFEIKNGIALSSGNLGSIKGGNKTPGTSGLAWDNRFRFKGDRDLGKLSKGKVCDQAFIEFDFIPLENEVKFNYIFASEEYKEYVGSRFNDVFGFIITGENNFFRNIAIIPQKTDPVAINNVNHLRNTQYFINNACFENSKIKKEVDDMEPREPFIKEIIFRLFGSKNKNFQINETERKGLDNELFENFEFDGLTRKLVASCFLIPYKLYHMKIAVGDVGDPMFDSGVFLESESFTATKNKNAPYFKNYEDQRTTFNFDSLFKYREQKPIVIDSPPMIEERFEITNINFDYNKSDIPDTCQINIRELALYLNKNKDYRVHLLGFTDNIGGLEFNQKLSEKRAIEVKNMLVRYKITEDRINYIGNNYNDPLANNAHEKGRAKNRRVEIVVLE
jgi:outer membrane protein OmpA-like peptidoglycan-associated protein